MIAGGAEVTLDPASKAAYLVAGDQWVSFDLPQTIFMKMEAAREMGLGGTSVWAADLDDDANSMMKLISSGQDPGPFETAAVDPTFPRAVAYITNWAQVCLGACQSRLLLKAGAAGAPGAGAGPEESRSSASPSLPAVPPRQLQLAPGAAAR